jgi:iron complex outermembrane receptor protein
MYQRNRLMLSCAIGAVLLSAGAAAAQTPASGPPQPATDSQSTQPSAATSDAAARASETSQSTQAASAAAVGDVVVTATARRVTLQKVPVAASVFSADRRNLVGIETSADIVNFTPSMSLNGEFLSIRGVGRYTDELGTDPGVANFVDGIYTPSPDYLSQPDFFADRIEVLRGPQGTLGGFNDIGGSTNVISKRPTDTFHEAARIGTNNYGYTFAEGSISGPITHDLDFRLADSYAWQPHNQGFVKNLDSKIYPGSGSSNLFEAQLDWKPTSNFDAWFRVQNYASDFTATYGVNPDAYTGFPPQTAFFANCPSINSAPFANANLQCAVPNPTDLQSTANPQIGHRGPSNSVIDVNAVGYTKLKDDYTFASQLTYSFPGATLEYIGGYSQYNYLYLSDTDGTPSGAQGTPPLPAGFLAQTNFGNQRENWYQNEIQLKSDNPGPLKWIVGVFQYWNNYNAPYNLSEPNNPSLATPEKPIVVGPAGPVCGFQPPVTSGPNAGSCSFGPANPFRDFYRQVANLTDQSEALFGQVDFQLTDTLRLTGGLRYNWDQKDGKVTFFNVFDNAGIFFDPPAFGTFFGPATGPTTESRTVKSSDWTGKIGLEWQPDPSTLLYASAAKGWKSAGIALADFVPIPEVKPEYLYDLEGGIKKTFGNQLLIDADAYYYDYHNLQQFVSALNPNSGLVSATLDSAQRARTYGFELESVWSPTPDFQVSLIYSYLNARFTQFSVPGGIVDFSQLAPGCVGIGAPGPAGTPGQCLGVNHANLSGGAIPQSPENKVTLNPVYTLHSPIGQFTFSATYAFIDKQYYSVFANSNFLAPSYSDVDLRLLYQPPQGNYTLIVSAHNVTNQLQIVNYSTGPFFSGPANLVKAPSLFPSRGQVTYFDLGPRVISAELQIRF